MNVDRALPFNSCFSPYPTEMANEKVKETATEKEKAKEKANEKEKAKEMEKTKEKAGVKAKAKPVNRSSILLPTLPIKYDFFSHVLLIPISAAN